MEWKASRTSGSALQGLGTEGTKCCYCSFSVECEAPAAGAEELGVSELGETELGEMELGTWETELGEMDLGETELGMWAGRAPGPHRAAGWCTEHRNFLPRRPPSAASTARLRPPMGTGPPVPACGYRPSGHHAPSSPSAEVHPWALSPSHPAAPRVLALCQLINAC
ncbi:unnamed protein product [Rangifer tarandus platyrhynchus]|uniref:Uncharacterized protein n=1 Tax=Rangifer tarandus platyrhynchus TaxID=3082113 RepID=A0ABN8ZCD8_RANTA|nr:unnamed protein product [Rangifer tarandus platyrhynchus]